MSRELTAAEVSARFNARFAHRISRAPSAMLPASQRVAPCITDIPDSNERTRLRHDGVALSQPTESAESDFSRALGLKVDVMTGARPVYGLNNGNTEPSAYGDAMTGAGATAVGGFLPLGAIASAVAPIVAPLAIDGVSWLVKKLRGSGAITIGGAASIGGAMNPNTLAAIKKNVAALFEKHKESYARSERELLGNVDESFWHRIHGQSFGAIKELLREISPEFASASDDKLNRAAYRALVRSVPRKFVVQSIRAARRGKMARDGSRMSATEELALKELNRKQNAEIKSTRVKAEADIAKADALVAKMKADFEGKLKDNVPFATQKNALVDALKTLVAKIDSASAQLTERLQDNLVGNKNPPERVADIDELDAPNAVPPGSQISKKFVSALSTTFKGLKMRARSMLRVAKDSTTAPELAAVTTKSEELIDNLQTNYAKVMEATASTPPPSETDDTASDMSDEEATSALAAAAAPSTSAAAAAPPNADILVEALKSVAKKKSSPPAGPMDAQEAVTPITTQVPPSTTGAPQPVAPGDPNAKPVTGPGVWSASGAAAIGGGSANIGAVMKPMFDYANEHILRHIPSGVDATLLPRALGAGIASHRANYHGNGSFWSRVKDIGKRALKFAKEHVAPVVKPIFVPLAKFALNKLMPKFSEKYKDFIDPALNTARSLIPGSEDAALQKDIPLDELRKRAPELVGRVAGPALDEVKKFAASKFADATPAATPVAAKGGRNADPMNAAGSGALMIGGMSSAAVDRLAEITSRLEALGLGSSHHKKKY